MVVVVVVGTFWRRVKSAPASGVYEQMTLLICKLECYTQRDLSWLPKFILLVGFMPVLPSSMVGKALDTIPHQLMLRENESVL